MIIYTLFFDVVTIAIEQTLVNNSDLETFLQQSYVITTYYTHGRAIESCSRSSRMVISLEVLGTTDLSTLLVVMHMGSNLTHQPVYYVTPVLGDEAVYPSYQNSHLRSCVSLRSLHESAYWRRNASLSVSASIVAYSCDISTGTLQWNVTLLKGKREKERMAEWSHYPSQHSADQW